MEFTNTLKVLNEFAQQVIESYRQGLIDANAIASHTLINSLKVVPPTIDGTRMEVSIQLAGYWKYIENGRQAYGEGYKGHIPPIKNIEEWIIAKPIIPGSTSGIPSYAALTPNLDGLNVAKSTNSLAWAIATNIAKKGIKAKPLLKESVDAAFEQFKSDISKAVAQDYGQLMVGEIGKIFSGIELSKVDGTWQGTTLTDTMVL